MTADIDLVMDGPEAVDGVLLDLGFARSSDGRHWDIPGTEVLLELPARTLDPAGAEFEIIEFDNGRRARVLSQIDVLLVRLLELTLGPRADITLQALALIPGIVNRERLMARAREIDAREKVTAVASMLERLVPVADGVAGGTLSIPDGDALYLLAAGE